MINILTRVSGRHKEFARCVASIRSQTYKDIRHIVTIDSHEDFDFVVEQMDGRRGTVIQVPKDQAPFGWNLYCNVLKEEVNEGWFFYLDSDDYLINKFCLGQIATQLSEHHGTVCQFKRPRGLPKPRLKAGDVPPSEIIRGKIGGSCIFLHHTHKNVADWDSSKAADYRFIKAVAEKIPLKFIEFVVVQAGNFGLHGK